VKVLLVPWSKTYGFNLRIYKLPVKDHVHPEVDLRTFNGQKIMLELIDRYALKKKLTTYNPDRSVRMAVQVELPNDLAERILTILSSLSHTKASVEKKVFTRLAESPSLKNLEKALAVEKLVGG